MLADVIVMVTDVMTTQLQILLADVIAMVVDVTTTQGVCVSWQMLKPNVADGITTGQHFFKLSSEMLSRTSSHICGRWYLPMFLFRDGLLTLMYRASFMVLMRFWSSLPNMEKLSIVTAWPEMLRWSCIGEGAFRCSLNLSSKFLADSPIYSSSQSTLSHLYLYMTPLFLGIGSLSFGAMRRSLMVWPPLRCTSIPYFLQVLLKLSLSPWW